MIEIWQQTQISNMLTHTKLLRHHDGTEFEKKDQNLQFFPHSRGTKCRVEANNNHEAVVVCARYVVKRHSKRSAIFVYYNTKCLVGYGCI